MEKSIIKVDSKKTLKKVLVCSPECFQIVMPINQTEINTFSKGVDVKKLVSEFNDFVKKLNIMGIKTMFLPTKTNLPQQTFVRDLGFTLGDRFYFGKSNVEIRKGEVKVAQEFLNCKKVFNFQNYLEGGDVVVFKNIIFVGISGRTNINAIEELKVLLKDRYEIVPIKLKSKILHLDTVLNVIGDIIVLNPNGIEKGFSPYLFTNKVVEVSLSEQFYLPTNFLTISPNTIIANKECKRTNLALKNLGVKIEEVSFKEMVKLGGSFRCCSIELLKE